MAAKQILAPLVNRVYLFNYFTKPQGTNEAFVESWVDASDYVKKADHFLSTHLHFSEGPETKYPFVNYAVFDSNDTFVFGKPDEQWRARMQKNAKTGLRPLPGEYNEISSYNGNAITDDKKHRPDAQRFFITAVTFQDSVSKDDLESNWASVMKTDFLHEKLGTKAVDSMLYRLVKSVVNSPVRYTVRTEVTGLDEKEGQELAELANKQQCKEGVETFTGFYKVHKNVDRA